MLIHDKRGISILEITLTIFLVAIVATMGISSYKTWNQNILVNNTQAEIKSALIRAQQLATAAADSSDWGFHLATSSYTIFPGSSYDELNPSNQTWQLENVQIFNPGSTFGDAFGVYGPDVVFTKFDGEANNTGTVSIILSTGTGNTKNVEVKASGQID